MAKKCPSCYGDGERRYQGEATLGICLECGGSGKFSDYLKVRRRNKESAYQFYKQRTLPMHPTEGVSPMACKKKLKTIPDNAKLKIKLLHDIGWPSAKIQKRFYSYTVRQIGALRGWMRRGGLRNQKT